jgi:regulator of sirC expression with transglutaminase-like and TPR domain
MRKDLVDALTSLTRTPEASLAQAALVIARIEYPDLEAAPYLARLDALGDEARYRIARHVDATRDPTAASRLKVLNTFLFEHERFVGNLQQYEDPRNSCLNQVLDRRTGIPITLSLVYMEVGARAGLHVDGVNFPGHFLVKCPDGQSTRSDGILLDPFNAGAILSERQCRLMLEKHVGADVAFDRQLLAPATNVQIIVRMLLNLKRLYVAMRSFPQARDVTELLMAISPSALNELRDRGLLAYHLNDLSAALHDLQTYLTLSSMSEADDETRKEREQLWEHVKTLRRRVATLN